MSEKIPTKEGSWQSTGLKISKKQSQQPFLHTGLSPKLQVREKPALNCPPALWVCHLSQLSPRSSCSPLPGDGTEAFPIQLELCSYILISFFLDQSGQSFGTNQTAKIRSPHLH